MTHRANVLRAYRELVWLAGRQPAAQREATLAEVRAAIRANATERDPGASSDQLKALCARISFLRVVRSAARRLSLCRLSAARR
jgi:hypothetical protein